MATFICGFGNRRFFPPKYMAEARKEIPEVLRSMGHKVLIMAEKTTRLGAVETREEGDLFAKFLEKNSGKYDGIIWSHPNFGDEVGMRRALRAAGKKNVPILLQAYPDEMDKMDPGQRRDSFCGIISTMDVLYQMGVPFIKLAPHVVSPKSLRFKENITLFAKICEGKAKNPYRPIKPEPVTRGKNILEGMVVLALGARTTPFYTTRFNELDAEKNGITVETADLSAVFAEMDRVRSTDSKYKQAEKRLKSYTCWKGVPQKALDQQVRLAVVLDKYIRELKPEAIGIRCWTEFQELRGISPCATISYLNHRGISTACEVDLGNAIAMAVMRRFSKGAVACQDWNNNWHDDDNKFIFMHCGPHDTDWLKKGHYVDTHRILSNAFGPNTGWGCIQGRFKPMVFTYSSCSTENGKLKFYVGTGRITDDKLPEDYFGSAGVVEIKGLQQALLHVGYGGFKHHFSMTQGDVAQRVITALRQHPGYEVTDLRKTVR